jgi:hypothetical protein
MTSEKPDICTQNSSKRKELGFFVHGNMQVAMGNGWTAMKKGHVGCGHHGLYPNARCKGTHQFLTWSGLVAHLTK